MAMKNESPSSCDGDSVITQAVVGHGFTVETKSQSLSRSTRRWSSSDSDSHGKTLHLTNIIKKEMSVERKARGQTLSGSNTC
jgi:hypothetical protein